MFVKDPGAAKHGQIYFHDIGDYLDQKEKLSIVREFGSIGGISKVNGWVQINPNQHHDWIGQRGQDFEKFLPISAKGGIEAGLFETHSAGLKTNRDVWVYDSSKKQLEARTQASIRFFNHQVDLRQVNPNYSVDTEPTKFKWCQATIGSVEKGRKIEFHEQVIQQAMYRPFLRTWVYKHKSLNWSSYIIFCRDVVPVFCMPICKKRVIRGYLFVGSGRKLLRWGAVTKQGRTIGGEAPNGKRRYVRSGNFLTIQRKINGL